MDILKCSGRASTILTEVQHNLIKFSEYNHAAEASQIKVIKKINLLKENAQQNNNQPTQVIQTIVSDKSQTLENLIIPENMKRTLDRVDFL
ncbi:19444_t:CDS:2, partial [Funneliformis geosporum]